MKLKKITTTLVAEKIDMGGLPVKQVLPTQKVSQIDPFLLIHHATIKPLYDRPAKIQGIGPHPHRGFSQVTFVIEGEIHHRDSRGNSQVAKAGEVQWMHAGARIIHSERPTENLLKKKGIQELIQLWINSPAKHKMNMPDYQYLTEQQIPRIELPDGLSDLKLIVGDYHSIHGKIKGQSDLLILWGKSKPAAKVTLDIPKGFNSCLYVIKGTLKIKGYGLLNTEHLVHFSQEGNQVVFEVQTEAEYLLLSGHPMDEKVVQHGPFVMNNQTQILEAMRDYQMGKMGVLIEDF